EEVKLGYFEAINGKCKELHGAKGEEVEDSTSNNLDLSTRMVLQHPQQGRQPWLPAASSDERPSCPIQATQNDEDDVLNPIPLSSSSINTHIANKSKTHLLQRRLTQQRPHAPSHRGQPICHQLHHAQAGDTNELSGDSSVLSYTIRSPLPAASSPSAHISRQPHATDPATIQPSDPPAPSADEHQASRSRWRYISMAHDSERQRPPSPWSFALPPDLVSRNRSAIAIQPHASITMSRADGQHLCPNRPPHAQPTSPSPTINPSTASSVRQTHLHLAMSKPSSNVHEQLTTTSTHQQPRWPHDPTVHDFGPATHVPLKWKQANQIRFKAGEVESLGRLARRRLSRTFNN
ncbi:hypothetical protein ACLOJK_006643, partial [Asimina triloba]